MRDTADLAAGKVSDRSNEPLMDRLLTDDDHFRVTTKLSDMLTSICDYCHERLGNLVSASPSEVEKEKSVNENTFNKTGEKEANNWNDRSWLSERATTVQVCKLASIVENFTDTCEKLCGKQCIALRSAFKVCIK